MTWTKTELSIMVTVGNIGKLSKGQIMPYLLAGLLKEEYLKERAKLMRKKRAEIIDLAVIKFREEGWAK